MVQRIHIVGRKNSGKTTLICALLEEFSRRGKNVATVKHTHHYHELDTPGKDSHRHRESGAAGVGIICPGMSAAFIPADRESSEDKYALFSTVFADRDLILVEGDLHADELKVEVWRAAVSETPYAMEDCGISAVISDDSASVTVPKWSRSDVSLIASNLLGLLDDSC